MSSDLFTFGYLAGTVVTLIIYTLMVYLVFKN